MRRWRNSGSSRLRRISVWEGKKESQKQNSPFYSDESSTAVSPPERWRRALATVLRSHSYGRRWSLLSSVADHCGYTTRGVTLRFTESVESEKLRCTSA